MRFRAIIVALGSYALSCTIALAQDQKSVERLVEELKAIPMLPPEQAARRGTELLANFFLDYSWKVLEEVKGRSSKKKPRIVVSMEAQTPHMEGDRLIVPVASYTEMMLTGTLLGHDIAVLNAADVPQQQAMLLQPLFAGKVIPQLSQLKIGADERFVTIASMGMVNACGPQFKVCQQAQIAAGLCLAMFTFGHEATHVRAGHGERKDGNYPSDEELVADEGGRVAVEGFIRRADMKEVFDSDVARIACKAAPAAYLGLLGGTSASTSTRKDLAMRQEKYISNLGDEETDVELAVRPELRRSGIGSLALTLSGSPETIVLDGVEVSAEDVEALVLEAGEHKALLVAQGALSLTTFEIATGRQTRLKPAFRELRSGSSEADVRALLKGRKWFDVLLCTTDARLRPARRELVQAHWQALQRLGLAALIVPTDGDGLSAAERRKGVRWRNEMVPGAAWDSDLSRME